MDIVAESLSAGRLNARDVTVNGRDVFEWFQAKLSAAVSFAGVFDDLSAAPERNGAIAIVRSRDYIYSSDAGEWQELGDEGQVGVLRGLVEELSSDLRYGIAEAEYAQAGAALSDRTVNLVAPPVGAASIDVDLPDPTPGRSRDFCLAVTCGSAAPRLNAPEGVILLNAEGGRPDLALAANATTVLRFTEVKEGDPGASPAVSAVFCVTGGANGGGSSAYVDSRLSNYLPLSGGTLSGQLGINGRGIALYSDDGTTGQVWMSPGDGMTITVADYTNPQRTRRYLFSAQEPYDREKVAQFGDLSVKADISALDGYLRLSALDGAVSAKADLSALDGAVSAKADLSALDSAVSAKADLSALDAKAESAALAPAWEAGRAYFKGDHVSYNGLLYECLSTVAGSTDPSADTTNWKLTDLAAPDATLDILSDGRLRVVSADGTPMWTQGYALASEPAVALFCEKINKYVFSATTATAFSDASTYAVGDRVVYGGKAYKCSTAVETAGAWTGATNWDEDPDTQAFALPGVPSGVAGDFVLDVDNTANEVPVMVAISGTLGTDYDLIVEKGRSSVDVLTIEGGTLAELYFTMTAFGTAAKPAWRVVRLNVERQGVGS